MKKWYIKVHLKDCMMNKWKKYLEIKKKLGIVLNTKDVCFLIPNTENKKYVIIYITANLNIK